MLDANVLMAGTVWSRWPHEVLRHALKKDYRLVLTQQVIDEAADGLALKYPDKLGAFRKLIARLSPEIVPAPTQKQVARNRGLVPDDETDVPIALAALNARVYCLVSEDKHLTEKNERTADLHRRLKVMLSGTFLREVMGWTGEELEAARGR